MTLLTDMLLFALPFGAALVVFHLSFSRFISDEDTAYFAAIMREMNRTTPRPALVAKAKAAGVA
jgi:hypothetical protein